MGRITRNRVPTNEVENKIITKREVLASITIFAVLFLIGLFISSKISESQMDKNEVYNKALKVDSSDMFSYGMRTNVGNAFVYGDLEAVDTVTYPEIGGEYMYIEKVEEHYTMHTRTVTHHSGKRSWTTTETYWTWDTVGREELKCDQVSFCGVTFDTAKIEIPNTDYIDTIKESSDVRYKYYGTATIFTGTIFADLKNNTIPDETTFYNGANIEETVSMLEESDGVVLFWVIWIIVIVLSIGGFYYIDNKWLE